MAKLSEKIGYGMGDMSSSMFWKIFSYYLPIFYSDVFGLTLAQTATLMFVTRLWVSALEDCLAEEQIAEGEIEAGITEISNENFEMTWNEALRASETSFEDSLDSIQIYALLP